MSAEEERFLTRWSRRKQEAGKPDELPTEAAEEKPAETPAAVPEAKPEEAFDLSKLPAIESLGRTSDYSMFMHKAVPDDLRLKALRRMWATDPVLGAPDLLDMHQWDYTGTEGIKPLVTPALEAIAALAREAAERAKKAAAEKQPAGESPPVETTEAPRPQDPEKQSSG